MTFFCFHYIICCLKTSSRCLHVVCDSVEDHKSNVLNWFSINFFCKLCYFYYNKTVHYINSLYPCNQMWMLHIIRQCLFFGAQSSTPDLESISLGLFKVWSRVLAPCTGELTTSLLYVNTKVVQLFGNFLLFILVPLKFCNANALSLHFSIIFSFSFFSFFFWFEFGFGLFLFL